MPLHALAELKASQWKKTVKWRIWQLRVTPILVIFNTLEFGDAVCNESDLECGWKVLQVLEGIVLRNQVANADISFVLRCFEEPGSILA